MSGTMEHPDWMVYVEAVRAGNQDAFEILVKQFQPLIRKTIRKFQWIAQTDDLYQEALFALYQAAIDYEKARGIAFPGYVEARIRFALWNYCKRILRLHTLETMAITYQDEDGDPVDAILLLPCPISASSFTEIELLEIFQILSERERLAVFQLLLDKRKPGDLAMECNVSVETVKTWRKRAIQKLKAEWMRIYSSAKA